MRAGKKKKKKKRKRKYLVSYLFPISKISISILLELIYFRVLCCVCVCVGVRKEKTWQNDTQVMGNGDEVNRYYLIVGAVVYWFLENGPTYCLRLFNT